VGVNLQESSKYLYVLAIKKQQDLRRIKLWTGAFLRQYKDFCIGAGIEVSGLAFVPESYHTAAAALERSFYNPHVRYFDFRDKKSYQSGLNSDLYSDFFQLLKNDPLKLTNWIDSIYDMFCELEAPRKEKVCALFTSFALAMLREKSTLYAQITHICSNAIELEQFILSCHSIFAIKQFISHLLAAYIEEMKDSSQYSRVVRDVMDYIAARCSNVDLDLLEIAGHVQLSTAHLGMLFKQETGTTIRQYLAEYRLELAKKLIASERYKIHAIAEICGYASASYFTKVFRASTNLTPVEYRKMIVK
jgi:two-component system response regulator YesN